MYFYRCTEQQLQDSLDRIHEAGDTLLTAVFKGGRDWVLICRKADTSESLADTVNAAASTGTRARLREAAHLLGPGQK